MKKVLIAMTGVAVALSAAPAASKNYVCTKWDNGICLSMKRVKGTPPPYAVGYVFGPNYTYTTLSDLPQPVVTYYHLGDTDRYVYANGYLYEVDPSTYAVIKVIDTYQH
jgi:hypothetical protein